MNFAALQFAGHPSVRTASTPSASSSTSRPTRADRERRGVRHGGYRRRQRHLAVYAVTKHCADNARLKPQTEPHQAYTYRYGPHSSADDDTVSKGESRCGARSAIRSRFPFLTNQKLWDEKKEEALVADVKAELAAALGGPKPSPAPDMMTVLDHTYSTAAQLGGAQRTRRRVGRLEVMMATVEAEKQTTLCTMVQAVRSALFDEMTLDPNVVTLGEDIGPRGGVFLVTEGLIDKFGKDRVIDTPLSELGIIGAAIGMAVYGLRPIAEIQFIDFLFPGFDMLVSEAAKMRYRSAGQFACPMVLRAADVAGVRGGGYHSQSPEAYFVATPGLKVVAPSNPYDAKGLLIASIRDDDPVVFMEPKKIYRFQKQEIPNGAYEVPLGKAAVAREGKHVSIITFGAMVTLAPAPRR